MSKKLQLLCLAIFSSMLFKAQVLQDDVSRSKTDGTQPPPQEWTDWFNKEVEKFVANQPAGKTADVNYRIPVVFHIIHTGQTAPAFPNIAASQVQSQMAVLNADFAGMGLNANTVPSVFSNLVSNTGIQFCLALKSPINVVLAEPGIDRINASAQGWSNPSATLSIVNYINAIKSVSIWPPDKYLNIWVSDKSPTLTIHGYATYPANTALPGLYSNLGTASNDGIWIWAKVLGDVGAIEPAPFDKGRTLTKQVGHWLGLRNIWGDGNCLDDFCSDTPWAKQPNSGCPPWPSYVNRCGLGQSPNGEMTMNFMDETNEICRYMFTPNQTTRMQTAMSQCIYRNLLGTHNLCTQQTLTAAPAVANFSFNELICAGVPVTPVNSSTGWPTPLYQWSSAPTIGINPAPSVASPALTFPTAGTYTLYMTATNTANIASHTMVVTAVNCPAQPFCIDTLKMIKNTDSLKLYNAPNNNFVTACQSGFAGFLTGTNCYHDKEFAQFFPASTYANIQLPQVNSVIVLFDSLGTKSHPSAPATQVNCNLYAGTAPTGPISLMASKNDSLKRIAKYMPKTYNIKYVGLSGQVTTTKIIPYKFDFAQPVVITPNSAGFFASVELPVTSLLDSVRIYHSTRYNGAIDSSAWVLTTPSNNWKTMKSNRGAKVQLGIHPQITCRPAVGIKEIATEFNSNIAVMPNPSSGEVNLVFTLNKETNLNLNVFNAFGQQIISEQMEHVSRNVVKMDLGNKPDGIYFIELSNGSERVVKKIVISH